MSNPHPKGTRKDETNRIRRLVLALPDLPAKEVATRIGCGISTVHKIRQKPGPDGRVRKSEKRRISRELRQLQDPHITLDDLTEALGGAGEPPPSRPWRVGTGPAERVEGDPYSDLGLAGYDQAKNTATDSLSPEIALLRAQIRRVAWQLESDELETRHVLRLQEHLAALNETLARLVRAHAASSRPTSPIEDALAAAAEEVLAMGGM